MVEKNRKLQNQFEAEASTSSHGVSGSAKPIFDGVSIFVDGFTVPSSQVLYCEVEREERVTELLLLGLDANVIFHDHVPPLVRAIHVNSIECVELLLQAGADPNIRKHGVTPLESAASEGLTEIIKCLLNAGADPNVTSFWLFLHLCYLVSPLGLLEVQGLYLVS